MESITRVSLKKDFELPKIHLSPSRDKRQSLRTKPQKETLLMTTSPMSRISRSKKKRANNVSVIDESEAVESQPYKPKHEFSRVKFNVSLASTCSLKTLET